MDYCGTFRNRMFATKAVAIWQAADETERPQVVAAYLGAAGGFEAPIVEEVRPSRTGQAAATRYGSWWRGGHWMAVDDMASVVTRQTEEMS